ncbi:methyl-accepting chemotaxis protein [Neobacillus sp. SM06]|uniref:methyl-accepting chemotaxis protein n=1 Tax=Neobacillus sp. SM06 TaxID=3422492 RepID=UPI003D2A861F
MKLTIGKKLYAGFLSIVLLLGVISGISFVQISSVDGIYNQLLKDRVQKMLIIKDMVSAMQKQQAASRGFLVMATDKEMQSYYQAKQQYDEISKSLEPLIKQAEDRAMFNELQSIAEKYDQASQQVFRLRKINDPRYQDEMNTKMAPQTEAYSKKSQEFVQRQQQKLDQEIQNTSKTVMWVKIIILAVSIVSLAIAVTIAFSIGKAITRPVKAVNAQLKEIAEGEADLTKKIAVKSKDEMGELAENFNKMLANLRTLIQHVAITTDQVAASSEQLTASADQTSKATESIASSIQEVAVGSEKQVTSMEESSKLINRMAQGIQLVANNAQNMTDSMVQTNTIAANGIVSVEKAVKQMSEIHSNVEKLSGVIQGLGEGSKEIGQIVEVISGIAAQTNLLALNAAIEAARAGDQGRGFAVVADEVRKLAEQSASSALQIAEMIKTIQMETEKAVESMHFTFAKVNDGIEVVNQAGTSFGTINQSMNHVAGQMEEVTSSVQQMAAGAEQIVQAIENVRGISEEAASGTQNISAAAEEQLATMEEIASSSKSLADQAENLQTLISRFKV